jgi:Flp pilus assembly protein TadD
MQRNDAQQRSGRARTSRTQASRKRSATHGGGRLFNAEAAYADSIFRSGLGDVEGSIVALEGALAALPTYAPAILSLGSVAYQRRQRAKGRRLFLSLLELPDDTPDLCEIIDEAGTFLIQTHEYADGLELYRRATARFPRVALLHTGIGCCAGHQGLREEAVAASRTACEIDPDNQNLVNDLGWSLYQAGQLEEAQHVLERAHGGGRRGVRVGSRPRASLDWHPPGPSWRRTLRCRRRLASPLARVDVGEVLALVGRHIREV